VARKNRNETSAMTPHVRKLVLTAHIVFSVGWLGAVSSFLALNIVGLFSHDVEAVRSSYFAMSLIAWFIIVPMCFAALATGFVQALGTEWGLLRYYWLLVKLSLTLFATIVLLMKMPLIGYAARCSAETISSCADLRITGMQLVVHSAGGLLVLLVITTLSVCKPWGRTRCGRFKQQGHVSPQTSISNPHALSDLDNGTTSDGSPLGLKRFLPVIVAIFVAFVAAHLVLSHLIASGLGSHGH
jgi:hypothetical protein